MSKKAAVPPDPDGPRLSDWRPPQRKEPSGHCLQWLREAATGWDQARADLKAAIKAARAAGWSWDSISEATAIDADILLRFYGPGRPSNL